MVRTHVNMIEEISSTVPTYVVRFEDLRTNPEAVMMDAMRFLFDVDSIEGTILEERIRKYCKSGVQKKAVYKLKSTSSNLSRNAHMYTEE